MCFSNPSPNHLTITQLPAWEQDNVVLSHKLYDKAG